MSDKEIALRLLLALLFGTLIGIERQWRHKTAGLKTNALVAMGAATFGLISQHGFGPGTNPAQVAAGVVTGIGFIGAGVIMRQGANVQGVNSAATLWVTAGAGLAVGAGFQKLAWIVLLLVLLSQVTLRHVAEWVDARSGQVSISTTYHLSLSCDATAAEAVRAMWGEFAAQTGVKVVRYEETKQAPAETSFQFACHLAPVRAQEMTALHHRLSEIAGVKQVGWSRTDIEAGGA
jgi:putative Mg2+ transporter-C (MgtC) family protein